MRAQMRLFAALTVFCSCAIAEEAIVDRAAEVKWRLETLNDLGRTCETQLQAEGVAGSKSDACRQYLNIQEAYSTFADEECSNLSKWYESMSQIVTAGAVDPVGIEQLFKDTQAVREACSPESLERYQFLTKPRETINALSDFE